MAGHPLNVADVHRVHADQIIIVVIVRFLKLHRSLTVTLEVVARKLLPGRRINRVADAVPDLLGAGRGGCDLKLV